MANLSNINNKFLVTTGGDVGINTTSPNARLHVNGTTFLEGTFGNPNTDAAYRIKFYDNGGVYNDAGIGLDGSGGGSEKMWFNAYSGFYWNQGTQGIKMMLDGTGRLGIGTDLPSSLLTLNATSGGALQWQYNGGNYLRIEADSGGGSYYAAAGFYHRFFTSGLERMRINSSGNVGIGTDSPGADLHVNSLNSQGTLTISRSGSNLAATNNVGSITFPADYNGTPTTYASIKAYANALSAVRGSLDLNVKSTSGSLLTGLTVYGTSSGVNVGIANTSPDEKLEISGDGTNYPHIKLSNPSQTGRYLKIGMIDSVNHCIETVGGSTYLTFKTVSAERMRIDSSGNVTLAITNTTSSTTIGKDGGGMWMETAGSTDALSDMRFQARASGAGNYSAIRIKPSNQSLEFQTSGAVRMLINSAGNATFTGNIYLPQSPGAIQGNGYPYTTYLGSGANATTTYIQAGSTFKTEIKLVGGDVGDFINFTAGNTERMRITSAGNSLFNYNNQVIETYGSGAYGGKVVIKASGAEGLALLNNSIGGNSQVALNFTNEFVANQYNFIARIIAEPEQSWTGTASTRDARLSFFTSQNGSAGEKMRISSEGHIQTNSMTSSGASLAYGLQIIKQLDYSQFYISSNNSSSRIIQRFYNPNGNVGNITMSQSSVTYSTTSDYRLKEDLQDFAGLDMVSKIPVYDFKWKTDESRSYGVMAHELQEVLPDAVLGEKDAEEMQGVDYSKIVPLLVKSIQELKADNDSLKARIETLENN